VRKTFIISLNIRKAVNSSSIRERASELLTLAGTKKSNFLSSLHPNTLTIFNGFPKFKSIKRMNNHDKLSQEREQEKKLISTHPKNWQSNLTYISRKHSNKAINQGYFFLTIHGKLWANGGRDKSWVGGERNESSVLITAE
jgi:hypothetical protein